MLKEKMEAALNEQINREMFSAYLYMSMSAYADRQGLKGISKWFMVQYHEEMVHAMKMFEYIADQGGTVILKTLAKPDYEFGSALNLFEKALEHEKFITGSINDIADLAISEKDYASKTFLDWYITEQIEEEKNNVDIIQTLKMIGENTGALYLYDKELGMRTVTVPTDFSQGVSAAMGAA